MPTIELNDYQLKIMARASNGLVYRGFFGWPAGSIIAAMLVRSIVDSGYLEFVYDWDRDRPALRLTEFGAARLREEMNGRLMRFSGALPNVDVRV